MVKKISKISRGAKVGMGAGVAAVAAGGALAAYLLAGKNSKAHRARAKKLFVKAKIDVLKTAKKLAKVDRAAYERAVDEVMKGYRLVKTIDRSDLVHVANDLKDRWSTMENEVRKVQGKALKVVKKVATKKAAKKLTPKKKK